MHAAPPLRIRARSVALVCFALLLLEHPPAIAQTSPAPLDEGHEDLSPLATSLRVVDAPENADLDFTRLYRSGSTFYRRSGAITATFDHSTYQATEGGALPVIPAGTIFHIGDAPATGLGSRVDLRVAFPMNGATPPQLESLATQRATIEVASQSLTRSASHRINPVPVWLASMANKDASPTDSEPEPTPRRRDVMSDEAHRHTRLAAIAQGPAMTAPRASRQDDLHTILGPELLASLNHSAPSAPSLSTAIAQQEQRRKAMLARVTDEND